MPAPPRRPPPPKIFRMTGRVNIFNQIHHDVVVKTDQFNNVVYVPSPSYTGPEIHVGDAVVLMDRRGGDGFKRTEEMIAPARIFSVIQKSRAPILYVMMGVAPSKPVPEHQAEAQRRASYNRPHYS